LLKEGQWKSGHRYIKSAYRGAVEEWTQEHEECYRKAVEEWTQVHEEWYRRAVEEWTQMHEVCLKEGSGRMDTDA